MYAIDFYTIYIYTHTYIHTVVMSPTIGQRQVRETMTSRHDSCRPAEYDLFVCFTRPEKLLGAISLGMSCLGNIWVDLAVLGRTY